MLPRRDRPEQRQLAPKRAAKFADKTRASTSAISLKSIECFVVGTGRSGRLKRLREENRSAGCAENRLREAAFLVEALRRMIHSDFKSKLAATQLAGDDFDVLQQLSPNAAAAIAGQNRQIVNVD